MDRHTWQELVLLWSGIAALIWWLQCRRGWDRGLKRRIEDKEAG